jgi:hypothetical protein
MVAHDKFSFVGRVAHTMTGAYRDQKLTGLSADMDAVRVGNILKGILQFMKKAISLTAF